MKMQEVASKIEKANSQECRRLIHSLCNSVMAASPQDLSQALIQIKHFNKHTFTPWMDGCLDG